MINDFAWFNDIQLLSLGVLTFVASYFDNNSCVELFSEDSKYCYKRSTL